MFFLLTILKQCNLQRCPDPQPEFDEQLWSLYQGLDYQLTEYNKFTAEPLKDEDTRRILPPTQVGQFRDTIATC